MSVTVPISRRALLAAGASLAWPGGAGAAVPSRPATLDWSILETLLALGHPPVAAAELVEYRNVAVEPPVPAGVADLGLRGLPNLETLLFARPDIIFNSNFYESLEPRLSLIAPVETFTLFEPGRSPYEPVVEMTRAIAARLGAPQTAQALIAGTEAELATLRGRLAGVTDRPVLSINFGDPRHFRTFGFDNLLGQTLPRLGLANAWTEVTGYTATAPVAIETLASYGEAWIAVIAPTPPDVAAVLARSAFWRALPAVKAGRVIWLEPVDPFGALPSMVRFGRLLTEALIRESATRG